MIFFLILEVIVIYTPLLKIFLNPVIQGNLESGKLRLFLNQSLYLIPNLVNQVLKSSYPVILN